MNDDTEDIMSEQTDRLTPPKQTLEDPNVADRRLSEEQMRGMKSEPDPPEPGKKGKLPDPVEVGEAG
ncbi:hypothetical protein [Caballeronia ptereochthonis]|uniref:Uncharacterized protein n=1 Tax=Caballeronia ptereochthonis TaxID=1777144 RepID=A0A158B9Y8_9BURK|nr:hypothetical protein [Caballeronia ptereochthonis]SAK66864.1 hypothetical protein AWB83_03009 [Caballeronia ptereochthonis]